MRTLNTSQLPVLSLMDTAKIKNITYYRHEENGSPAEEGTESMTEALLKEIRQGSLAGLSKNTYAIFPEVVKIPRNEEKPDTDLSRIKSLDPACVIFCFSEDNPMPKIIGNEVVVFFLPNENHVDFIVCNKKDFLWITRYTETPEGVVARELSTHEALDSKGRKQGRDVMESFQHSAIGILKNINKGKLKFMPAYPGANRIFPSTGLRVINNEKKLIVKIISNNYMN